MKDDINKIDFSPYFRGFYMVFIVAFLFSLGILYTILGLFSIFFDSNFEIEENANLTIDSIDYKCSSILVIKKCDVNYNFLNMILMIY